MHICRLVDMQNKSYDSSVRTDERNAAICSSSIHTKLSRRGSKEAVQCAMMKLVGDEKRAAKKREVVQDAKKSERLARQKETWRKPMKSEDDDQMGSGGASSSTASPMEVTRADVQNKSSEKDIRMDKVEEKENSEADCKRAKLTCLNFASQDLRCIRGEAEVRGKFIKEKKAKVA